MVTRVAAGTAPPASASTRMPALRSNLYWARQTRHPRSRRRNRASNW